MTIMVSTAPRGARSLTEIAPECLRSLSGDGTWLPPAASVVLVLIDGLGAIPLRGHTGYARRLSSAMSRRDVATSVFPSTTAAALTSLVTGEEPGMHGLVGYRVRDPDSGRLVQQLSGYGPGGVDPASWQRSRTIFERATAKGAPAFAVGRAEYAGSGFSGAVLRGAEYVGEDDVRSRLSVAYELAARHRGCLVYCYLPEIDKAGHKHGMRSDAWLAALEEVDGAFSAAVPDGIGVVVTADHGMVDVPRHRHVLLRDGDERLDGVSAIGGEPRMLHAYLTPGADAREVARTWRRLCPVEAEVATRDEAIASGLFGRVDAAVVPRIGDVLVAARGLWAFYDDRPADKHAQDMIGQHGSTTPEETIVPLIRLGAFAG